MAGIARFTEFFGLRRSTVGMLCMVILVGMGERMAERFLPIYLMALGGGALSIGALSGLDNLLSALYSFPGGYLSDRLGTKRALLVFNIMAMCGFLLVILIPAWQAVLVGAVFFLSWTAISLPATMSLIAKVLPINKRTMGVSMHSFVRRIPMALGPILGGLCIGIWGERNGVRVAFVAAFLLSGVAALLQQHLIEDVRPEKADGEQSPIPEKNQEKTISQFIDDFFKKPRIHVAGRAIHTSAHWTDPAPQVAMGRGLHLQDSGKPPWITRLYRNRAFRQDPVKDLPVGDSLVIQWNQVDIKGYFFCEECL